MAKNSHNRDTGSRKSAKPTRSTHPGLSLGLSEEELKTADSHPELKKLVGYLAKNGMDSEKQRSFVRWRSGDKHAKLPPEQIELSNKLWEMVEQKSETLASGAASAQSETREAIRNTGVANQKTDYAGAADPAVFGEPFHNPYTFIPFGTSPVRRPPTPHSVGEVEKDRSSGVLILKVQTISPLLTCSPMPMVENTDHKSYRALTVDEDVIVPATGIRGSLRTLMTILTGGTLGYVDENLFLIQDRDVHLGPKGKKSPEGTPENVFLAEVIVVGTANSSGLIRLGTTRLEIAETLESLSHSLPRPKPNKDVEHLWADAQLIPGDDRHAAVYSLCKTQDSKHQWKVKLSGRPVGGKARNKSKREGLFLPDGDTIELPDKFWADYQGRNRHSDHSELKSGDLVWLQPDRSDRRKITEVGHIKSLQWARWGRAGENLLDVLKQHHPAVIPDCFRDDGLVDEVTDLFGHVPDVKHAHAAPAFRARIRPENLVFFDAKKKLAPAVLAPLSTPHPGCVAFYRDSDEIANYGQGLPLRGYKVYRTTIERGDTAPWHYATQGIYHNGRLKDSQQKQNKTCELLADNVSGTLRIAFHDLSNRELALLIMACSVDWRLGGGKPLGLGHCRIVAASMIDEFGTHSQLFTRPANEASAYPSSAEIGQYAEPVQELSQRVRLWHESQRPVTKLRYPRASDENKNTVTVGGHTWFGRHAAKRKGSGVSGLEVVHVSPNSDLACVTDGKRQIRPQPLPVLSAENATNDQLFGYELHISEEDKEEVNNQTQIKRLETFDPEKHCSDQHISGGNQSQNRDSRSNHKRRRND